MLDNLDRVKHTTVRCEMTLSPPDSVGALPEERTVTVPSLRLDAMVAAVYKLSRSESQRLFMQKLIFVNGKMTVKWDGQARCVVNLPATLPAVLENLLLTCSPE